MISSQNLHKHALSVPENEPADEWAQAVWDRLQTKLEAECERTGSNIPFIPVSGRYRDCMMPGGLSWWTNGFWPGILWQMYHATGKALYADAARSADARLITVLDKPDTLDHDIGFLFLPGSIAEYRLTGNTEARLAGLRAADLLAGRFNETGGFIRAWNESPWVDDVSGWMIIDCMLNIPLLSWASLETGDSRYEDIARMHADTALRFLLRPDGSTGHIACFDPDSGKFLGTHRGQGYGEDSSWSRGQGWALYGFALAYRNLGSPEYLNAAKRSAHYCIAALAANAWIPTADFRAPSEPFIPDSGAGALIACGLLELSVLVSEPERHLYRSAAIELLRTCEKRFALWNPDTDGILTGGSMMYHNDRLAGQAFINSDYFFLEAILKLLGKDFPVWGAPGCPDNGTGLHHFGNLPAQPGTDPVEYSFAHAGIHCEDEASCSAAAEQFARAFGFPCFDTGSSIICAGPMEITKSPVRGVSGHIGISVSDMEKAMADLKSKGFPLDMETLQTGPDGRPQSVYLTGTFGGFAVHLLRKMPDRKRADQKE